MKTTMLHTVPFLHFRTESNKNNTETIQVEINLNPYNDKGNHKFLFLIPSRTCSRMENKIHRNIFELRFCLSHLFNELFTLGFWGAFGSNILTNFKLIVLDTLFGYYLTVVVLSM